MEILSHSKRCIEKPHFSLRFTTLLSGLFIHSDLIPLTHFKTAAFYITADSQLGAG